MSRPAQPERNDPTIGDSNPAKSLWDESKPYVGPPEEGQPRKGAKNPAPSTTPVIMGEPEDKK